LAGYLLDKNFLGPIIIISRKYSNSSHQNLKPCFGHNFGTAQDIDMIQTPISFFFQALSDGLTFS
jgi:hypothetical protein